jgi:transglutaminase-like putative cysteine protease
MSSMLRLQGIPAKLVIGYAGALYHAWINVYIEDIGWIDQAVYFDGKQWSLMDPTFVSTSNSTNAVKQFVGEGNNYSQKFVY